MPKRGPTKTQQILRESRERVDVAQYAVNDVVKLAQATDTGNGTAKASSKKEKTPATEGATLPTL